MTKYLNMKKLLQTRTLFISLFLFTSCSYSDKNLQNNVNSDSQQEVNPLLCRELEPRLTFPRDQTEKNKALYSLLKKVGVYVNKKGTLSVQEFSCNLSIRNESMTSTCDYFDTQLNKQKVSKQTASEDAEDLRLFLSEYPLIQGDSGVYVKNIHCELFEKIPKCWISIPLDLQAP